MSNQENVTEVVSVDPSALVSKAPAALIAMSQGSCFGKRYSLEEASMSLGRAAECSIQIDQQGVSRRHFTLITEATGVVRLEDAGSTNGTLLNGRWLRPGESVQLQDGDHIWCGGILLKFIAKGNCEHVFLEELHRKACFDSLTGIFNRGHFQVLGEAEFQRAKRHDHLLSLLLLDLDHFKTLNDRFGHLCGDKVLQETAELIQQRLRREDILARWGRGVRCPAAGDESRGCFHRGPRPPHHGRRALLSLPGRTGQGDDFRGRREPGNASTGTGRPVRLVRRAALASQTKGTEPSLPGGAKHTTPRSRRNGLATGQCLDVRYPGGHGANRALNAAVGKLTENLWRRRWSRVLADDRGVRTVASARMPSSVGRGLGQSLWVLRNRAAGLRHRQSLAQMSNAVSR